MIEQTNNVCNDVLNNTNKNITNTIQTDFKTKIVLTLCYIPYFLNVKILEDEIKKYMEPRKSFYKQKKRSPFIEDEFSEYFTALASDGFEIGGGNCGTDIKTKNNEGIDVMCVILNRNLSNEKSLIQNFASSGLDLDLLFKEKKDNEAVKLFMNDYKQKLENTKEKKNLNELFILSFISTNKDIYIACFKINIENIEYVHSCGFVEGKKNNFVNILIGNFIDSNIGRVTLYKSKKRIEFRLKKEILQSKYVCKIFSM